jgi:transmembrane sensor
MQHESSTAREIEEQAAIWCARLLGPSEEEVDDQAFQDWISSDPEHQAAFDGMVQAWLSVENIDHRQLIAPDPEDVPVAPSVQPGKWFYRFHSRRRVLALAASLSAVLAAGGFYYSQLPTVYTTEAGAQLAVELDDGSRLSLDASSRVRYKQSGDVRQLWLDRGRAAFEVSPDAQRPFSVAVRDRVVVAIGTEFTVEELPGQVRVSLYSGKVAVLTSSSTETGTRQLLAPGDRLTLFDDGQPQALSRGVSEDDLDWTAGVLTFHNEALPVAIEQMNRHSARRIEVPADLASQKISGVFEASETDAFISAVCALFDLRVQQDGEIVRLVHTAGE